MDTTNQEGGVEHPGGTCIAPIKIQMDEEERTPIEELLISDSEDEDFDPEQAEKRLKQLQNMRDEIIKQLEILNTQVYLQSITEKEE